MKNIIGANECSDREFAVNDHFQKCEDENIGISQKYDPLKRRIP